MSTNQIPWKWFDYHPEERGESQRSATKETEGSICLTQRGLNFAVDNNYDDE
jgi:hypothetical protein